MCKALLAQIGAQYGLEPDDCTSRGMGQNGVDVVLSPAAQKVFQKLQVECKNVEKLNVVQTFQQHYTKYKEKGLPILVHSRNHTEPMVTLSFNDFINMFSCLCVGMALQYKKAT